MPLPLAVGLAVFALLAGWLSGALAVLLGGWRVFVLIARASLWS